MLFKVGLLCSVVLALSVITEAKRDPVVGCYFGSWTTYRTGPGAYNTSFIDPFQCTQLKYAFAGISGEGEITILDPYNELETDYGKGTIKKFNDLKKINPELETYITVGGWNAGSTNFSIVAADLSLSKNFAKSCLKFLIQYEFNGLAMDWEYPMQRNDLHNNDRLNFNRLLKLIKNEFKPYGFKLQVAVAAPKNSATLSYDIAPMAKIVDHIQIMAYDFHVGSEPNADFNAPLYPAKRENEQQRLNNLEAVLKFWISQAGAKKIVLGTPFYGHNYQLADPTNTKPGAPSKGPGPAGTYTQEGGTISYNELCIQWQTEQWTHVFDDEQQVPYAYNKDGVWVSYENSKSMYLKGQLAKKLGIAGVMAWSLENDDFNGICSGRKHTLLYALNQGVNSKYAQRINCEK